ncbi:hypothetical protein Hanom_Chr08g00734331 [Helianthus anomalus]
MYLIVMVLECYHRCCLVYRWFFVCLNSSYVCVKTLVIEVQFFDLFLYDVVLAVVWLLKSSKSAI